MLNKFLMASVFVFGLAAPALAEDCSEPIPPAAIDGNTATTDQMKGARADVENFIKSSDDYQSCLNSDFVEMQQKAKKDKKPLDPSVQTELNDKITRNQGLKEKVGAEYNTAVAAYKAKHP